MKQIKITHIIYPDKSSVYIERKMYRVFLGNHAIFKTNSLKDALQKLARTNRFLNQQLHELNNIYANTLMFYRMQWFYFEDSTQKINSTINMLEHTFELAAKRSHFSNGNHFTFHHLYSLIQYLSFILNEIIKVMLQKKFFSEIYKVNIYLLQLVRLKARIEEWGLNGFYDVELSEDYFKNLEKEINFDFTEDK